MKRLLVKLLHSRIHNAVPQDSSNWQKAASEKENFTAPETFVLRSEVLICVENSRQTPLQSHCKCLGFCNLVVAH